jgi:hypothetical protein
MDAGKNVILQMKREPFDRYYGQIVALEDEHIALLHTGTSGGVRWTIPINEIAFCGISLETPSSLLLSESKQMPQECRHKFPNSTNEDEPPFSQLPY